MVVKMDWSTGRFLNTTDGLGSCTTVQSEATYQHDGSCLALPMLVQHLICVTPSSSRWFCTAGHCSSRRLSVSTWQTSDSDSLPVSDRHQEPYIVKNNLLLLQGLCQNLAVVVYFHDFSMCMRMLLWGDNARRRPLGACNCGRKTRSSLSAIKTSNTA